MKSRLFLAALLLLIPALAACEGHGEHRDDDHDRGHDRDDHRDRDRDDHDWDRDRDRRSDLRRNLEKLMGPSSHVYAVCELCHSLDASPST